MKNNFFAPVALFVYNRADHFKQTYAALRKCEGAQNTDLFIFSDGAKNEKAEAGVKETRNALEEIKNDDAFASITVFESEKNKGLAASIIDGVTKIINDYGKIIVLEDDCVASDYLLKFFNGALSFYENDKTIGSVAGYTPKIPFPANFNDDMFLAYRSCSCCWATWKRSWEGVDWEIKNAKELFSSGKFIRDFTLNGTDRILRLYRQTKGDGTSWSVRFGAHLTQKGLFTVYPKFSYISNIGCDCSGVHSKAGDAETMAVDLDKAVANPAFKEIKIDKGIQRSLKKHYSGGAISDIKRTAAIAMIYIKANLRKK